MSNDGKKSDEDGGDLERTEEKSAAELEAIVKAAEGGVDDEITHTGDPGEIERAALASIHPTDDEDEPPPSSEGAPVSMRDFEAEPASSRDFEPVSLHDVEVAMAPGKAPPKIPAVPAAPRVPAVPRAPVPAAGKPATPAVEATDEEAPKGPVFAGAAAAKPKIVPRAPLKPRQPSQPDPEEVGAVPSIRKRVSSIPPPLPKPGSDGDIMRLSGGLSAPLVPSDLAIPLPGGDTMADADADGAEKAAARPAPPKKKKPAIEEAAAASTEEAPKSERAPGSKRSKRPSKGPSKEEPAAAEATPKKSKRPPKSERPGGVTPSKRPTDAQTTPPEEPAKSRTTMYLVGAAALVLVGYFAFGRGGDAPKPVTDANVETAKPEPPEPPPAETMGTTPEPPQAATDSSATPEPPASDTARATGPQPPVTSRPGSPTGNNTTSAPATPNTATPTTPTTAKPAASAAPAVASGPFDRSAASAAMSTAVGTASGCKKEGDPSGVAHVTVTFAPSGRVTQANIGGPPFAGTPTGGCIARAFKTAKVPPFEGDPVTVSKTVNIP